MLVSNSQNMRGFAMNFTRNSDDADDLVQDTLFKALKYKSHFADGTNFKGWLYTIMRNIFLNNCKKNQLGNKIFTRTDAHQSPDWRTVSENNIYSSISEQDIKLAIDGLKDDLKIPFQLMIDGYLYDEVAEHVHVPTGTIKSRIFNARKKLMDKLQDYN